MGDPFLSNLLRNDVSQSRVAQEEPTAGSDAVRLVLELVRVHHVEVVEPFINSFSIRVNQLKKKCLQITLEDVRVDSGHSVHSVRSNDGQIGHIDALSLVLFDEGHAADYVTIAREIFAHVL